MKEAAAGRCHDELSSERPMAIAQFRFYEELNDFLAPARRGQDFELRCAEAASVKNAIESVGVPHTEVELILANGESVDFAYRVRDGDRISVFPMFESFDVASLLRVRPRPLREPLAQGLAGDRTSRGPRGGAPR